MPSISDLEEQIESLKAEKAKLDRRTTSLADTVERLSGEKHDLRLKLTQARRDFTRVDTRARILKEENTALTNMLGGRPAPRRAASADHDALAELKRENGQLKKQKVRLNGELTKAKNRIERLEEKLANTVQNPTYRYCLSCGRQFKSQGSGNRLCDNCK